MGADRQSGRARRGRKVGTGTFMSTTTTEQKTKQDYKVADISLADFGRKEIGIAEKEMPGLMAIREKYAPGKPLADVRVTGSLHMTVQSPASRFSPGRGNRLKIIGGAPIALSRIRTAKGPNLLSMMAATRPCSFT